jgi:hypothetical protein
MATQAYYDWVKAGRKYVLATWVTELKAQCRANGVQWLGDLGNEEHLQSSNPQDHTPFSRTDWPVPQPDYIVNACDFKEGRHAYRLLEEAKAGRAPFVKYINVDNKQYNVKNNWQPVYSSDKHCHVSGKTTHSFVGLNGINIFAERVEEEDVATAAEIASELLKHPAFTDLLYRVRSIHKGEVVSQGYTKDEPNDIVARLKRIEEKLDIENGEVDA